MANQTITQLPNAGPITGTELVPIVQNGGTYKTTTAAIANSPTQNQTFVTQSQETTLNNSRYLSVGTGLQLTDGGAQSFLRVNMTGAADSLNSASGGFIVKDSASTVASRTLTTSGPGLNIANADGTGANPVFSLTGAVASLAAFPSTGVLALRPGGTIASLSITGTANEIDVADGNGQFGDPVIGIADNPVLPGTGSVKVPVGNNAQQPVGSNGEFRYNTDLAAFEGYAGGAWQSFPIGTGVNTFSAGTTGLSPSSPTTGAIVLSGTLGVANGGTGANSLTGYVKGSGTSAFTASATVPTSDLSGTVSNAQLANSSLTVNGTTISLGGSGTITAAAANPLTIGTGLSGTSYNGSTPVTVAISNTGVSAGSYGGASKTLSATVNAQGQLTALSESPIAIANTQVSGLGTMSTQNASSVAITGGTINGTTIGASTPAAGTFSSVATTTGTISTTPVNATDIANKSYVDTIAAQGITYHDPVKYEVPSTTGNLVATYNNGVAGVGATLTNAGTLAAFAPDGPTAAPGDRILIYNQTNQFENGVYEVTTVGSGSVAWVLTRAADADSYGLKDPNALGSGDAFFVTSGNTGAGETYVCNTAGVITFGTTAITFAQVSSAQIYSAGTGLTLSGTQFSITNTGVSASTYGTASSVPTLAINAQGQVTSASNTSIAINANQITSGSITNAQLQNSSLTVNGTAISLGGSGTITAANPNALTIGTGLTGTSYDGSAPITIALATSGVTPATYGSASQVPVFAVDTYGRVTSVTNTSIAIAAGAVSGLAPSATTDTTNASNITSGTLGSARLSGSYTGITGVGTLTAGTWNANAIGVAYGGTGLTSTPTNGQLPIGNGTGYTLATLTAGTNVFITNGAGGITISATASAGGTVTSVDVSGGTTGLTTSGGPITTSGTITLAGTLNVANGGTGATTLTGYVKGNGTSAFTASSTIPNTDITGLGTMSTQNANSVAITGGTIEGTSVGATTASTVRGTTITATTQFSGPGTGLTGTASGLSIGGNAATASTASQVANAVTFNNGGAGGASGSTFNGSGALTVSYNTIGAPSTTGTNASGTWNISISGNAATATSATSATTATNLAGGAANRIAYQTGSGATNFIVAPTVANTYLEWSGSAFQWSSNPVGTVTSITAGAYLTGGTITTSGTIAVDATSANTASKVVARDASGNFSAGTITAALSGNATTATTATNLAGGGAGQIPYNTGSGTTAFLAAGTSGFVLRSNGTSAPSWSALDGGTF